MKKSQIKSKLDYDLCYIAKTYAIKPDKINKKNNNNE